jgi:hypothetical protein
MPRPQRSSRTNPPKSRSKDSKELATVLLRSTIWLTFVESRVFTARWHSRLDDEALRALQNELLVDPEKGDAIPGCGVLRKVRFGDPARGKGKRGGVRVIYLHTPEATRIDLITVYGKDEKDDLTKDEVKLLCELAHRLRNECKAGAVRTVRWKKRGAP